MPPARRRPARARRAALQLLAVAAVLLAAELLLALAGVRPLSETEDPFVGFSGATPLFEERPGPAGPVMATAPGKLRLFNAQEFPRDKPPGAVRIACVGGSTTYGHPYDDPLSYSAWLRELLPAAQPGTAFEVINAGGISYASYREALLVEELCRYAPDALVIYSGPNEFLEQRTYPGLAGGGPLATVGGWLSRLRCFTLARRAVDALRQAPDGRARLPGEVDTRLDHPAGLELYLRDDALRDQVLEHFRRNLARMVRTARDAGARVVLVAPASQLRGCAPFKSEASPGLSPAQADAARVLRGQGEAAAQAGRPAEALDALQRAAALDPRHAGGLYLLGEALFAAGRAGEARAVLERARDEDVCPLRPPTSLRDDVRHVAQAEGAGFLDFVQVVDDECERRFGHRVPGREQFLDHVHLDLQGYRLLALALLEALAQQGLLRPAPGWQAALPAIDARMAARLDPQRQGLALRNLAKTLSWAGKHAEADALAREALAVLGGTDAESSFVLGNGALAGGRWDEAAQAFRAAVAADPARADAWLNLADAERRAGRPDAALEALERTLALDEAQGQAHSLRALLLDARGESEAALASAHRAVELVPGDALAHNNLGLVLAHAGRADEAAASFERAARIDPGHVPSRLNLARVRLAQGRAAEAAAALRELLARDPAQAEARALLAEAERRG